MKREANPPSINGRMLMSDTHFPGQCRSSFLMRSQRLMGFSSAPGSSTVLQLRLSERLYAHALLVSLLSHQGVTSGEPTILQVDQGNFEALLEKWTDTLIAGA